MSGGGAFGANRVGGIIPAKGEIELNAGRPVTKLKVRNTGDRPVQIGSHFHFFEVNRAIEMDREKAFVWSPAWNRMSSWCPTLASKWFMVLTIWLMAGLVLRARVPTTVI